MPELLDAHAADPPMSDCTKPDWAGHRLSLAVVWGLPAAVMLLALLLGPVARAVVWVVMLAWMGGACVANARRCGQLFDADPHAPVIRPGGHL